MFYQEEVDGQAANDEPVACRYSGIGVHRAFDWSAKATLCKRGLFTSRRHVFVDQGLEAGRPLWRHVPTGFDSPDRDSWSNEA